MKGIRYFIFSLLNLAFNVLIFVDTYYTMTITYCNREYSEQILAIFNEAILNSTALYDYYPRTMNMMEDWFDAKQKGNYPIIGLVDDNDTLLAFGTYGKFRERPAYKYTVEHSLYVHLAHRGKGYGKIILGELIKIAKEQQYHCLVAGIDDLNEISKSLHSSFGFMQSGHLPGVGFKFGKWLNLDLYQLILATPINPVDG